MNLKKGSKGFTLVELMVVMAILAVLSAIVIPAVSGTKEVGTESQVMTDAGAVQSAVGDYFADVTGAEARTTSTVSILTATVISDVAQVTSNKWPERTIKARYGSEFPDTNVATISGVVFADKDGALITALTPKVFAQSYNAINFSVLVPSTGETYLPTIPLGADTTTTLTLGTTPAPVAVHNFLWLLKKATPQGGEVDSGRNVEVYKLTMAIVSETTKLAALTYEQIY